MKKLILSTAVILFSAALSFSQIMPLMLEPDGGNKKASISEQIGIVKIEIRYSRPGVKGREDNIWNTPVAHYGFVDLGHGTSYAAPWRAGANENTTISFSHPVKIDGKDLPAGIYGFFISLGETESTLIFSKNATSWGSFYYEAEADALRVTVKNQTLQNNVEWLKYEFLNETDSSTSIALSWEKRMIPFTVSAETKKLQILAFKQDLKTTRPSDDFITAANYCLDNNIELEQALAWIDRGIYFRVMGQKTFRILNTKAEIMIRLNRMEEARKIMDEAIPLGNNMGDVHYYARKFLSAGLKEEAFKYFKGNFEKFPEEFTTNVGMGRGYSAMGDYKKALTYMKAALPKAPNELNKNSVVAMIKKLEEGKDVNQ